MNEELANKIEKLLQDIAYVNSYIVGNVQAGQLIKYKIADKEATTEIYYKIITENGFWILTPQQYSGWANIKQDLCKLNRENVSLETTEKYLINLVSEYRESNWDNTRLAKLIGTLINNIANIKTVAREVRLPIFGLVVKVPSLKIGEVEFRPCTDYPEIIKDLERNAEKQGMPGQYNIQTVSSVCVRGDDQLVLENAEDKVNQALTIFRAFTFPIIADSGWKQIGIMGTYYTLGKLYYVEPPAEIADYANKMEGASLSGIVDFTVDMTRIQILNQIGLIEISRLLTATCSTFESALIRATEWIGEATKPDSIESKFIKLAFALDAMIGDESDNIPSKGIRARLAERSAFLLSESSNGRKQVYEQISDFIAKRNKIAHGSKEKIDILEAERFGTYVRSVLFKLLERKPHFNSTLELANWVLLESFK